MRLPLLNENDPSSIDVEKTKELVDTFLEKGFTYFDTAYMYCGYKSENAVKDALTSRHPRESFLLADKLHAEYIRSKPDRDRIFNEQLEKTGAEYFDYYLLHDMGSNHYGIYRELDCFNWLEEKKAQGLVKNIGFSFHDTADVLETILSEQSGLDFIQLQINYLDWESEGIQSKRCYEVAQKYGLPVIVMEPVKGGTLAKLPEKAEALLKSYAPEMSIPSFAIRFAASLDNVITVLSGMGNMAQLEDNTGYMEDFVPLTEREKEMLKEVADIINENVAVACTGCAYCVSGCPVNIPIPKYFSLYNADMQEATDKGWLPQTEYYENLTLVFPKASDCIACGQCENICPQHLPVINRLKDVAAHFEG